MINELHFENFPNLESERLLYRAFNLSDAEDIFFIRTNEEVMTYMDSESYETIDDAKHFISKGLDSYKNQKAIAWAIIEKATGKFIGDVSYWRIEVENQRGELGYTLKPEFWNKGYMTEALHSILQFGFEELYLHSVVADINPDNIGSQKVLLKSGFKKEAYFRENRFFRGDFIDSEIYVLLNREFQY